MDVSIHIQNMVHIQANNVYSLQVNIWPKMKWNSGTVGIFTIVKNKKQHSLQNVAYLSGKYQTNQLFYRKPSIVMNISGFISFTCVGAILVLTQYPVAHTTLFRVLHQNKFLQTLATGWYMCEHLCYSIKRWFLGLYQRSRPLCHS